MNQEGIMLGEMSQTEKDNYCIVSFKCGILKKKKSNSETKRGKCSPVTAGRRNGELLLNGYRISVWDAVKVLKMDSGNGCTTL